MAAQICPACQHSFEVAESERGREVTCPMCGRESRSASVANIAAGLPSASDDHYESYGRRRALDDLDDMLLDASHSKWRLSLIGLKMAWWSTLVLLIVSVGLNVSQIVSPMDANDPNAMNNPLLVATMMVGCGAGIAYLVYFVGVGLCCSAPHPAAKRYALISIISFVAFVGFYLAFCIVAAVLIMDQAQQQQVGQAQQQQVFDVKALMAKSGGAVIAMGSILTVLLLMCYLSWFMFHAAVGSAFGNRSLRRLAFINMAIWPLMVVIPLAAAFCPGSMLGVDDLTMLQLQGGAGLFFNLVTYGMYLLLGAQAIATIAAGLNPPAE